MRISSYIFSVSFVLIFGVLHLETLFANNEVKKVQTCTKATKKSPCAKSKSKCTKEKPSKKETSQKKDDCNNEGCNPFTPCPIGSCCYLIENFFSYTSVSIVKKQKIALFNDNRLLNNLSECWRPPKTLS